MIRRLLAVTAAVVCTMAVAQPASAQIIDPGGAAARNWELGLSLLTALIGGHIALACLRGGRLRYFFWPFNVVWFVRRLGRGGLYSQARDAVWDFVYAIVAALIAWRLAVGAADTITSHTTSMVLGLPIGWAIAISAVLSVLLAVVAAVAGIRRIGRRA